MKNNIIQQLLRYRSFILITMMQCLAVIVIAQNQVTVQLQLQAPYSYRLHDYLSLNNAIIILQNNTNATQSIKIKGSIEGDEDFLIYTNDNYTPNQAITLAPNEVKQIFANVSSIDFLDEANIVMEIDPQVEQTMYRTGNLPEGNYTICLQAFDFNDDTPLSMEAPSGCADIPIIFPNPPELIEPDCEDGTASQYPIFSWTPTVSGVPGSQIVYDLYVVEKIIGQNDPDINLLMAQAIGTGLRIHHKVTDLPNNTYIYPPNAFPLKDNYTYYWAVVARDANRIISMVNSGRSEACSFLVGQDLLDDEIINVPYISNLPACLNCAFDIQNTTVLTSPTIDNNSFLALNFFDLSVTAVTSGPDNNGKFSGEGTIEVPFLNSRLVDIRVSFTNAQVNGAYRIIQADEIKAIVNPEGTTFMPGYGGPPDGMSYLPSQLDDMEDFFANTPERVIADGANFIQSVGFELPFGIESDGHLFAITQLNLSPTSTSFAAAVIVSIGETLDKIALGAKDVCIDNQDFCGEAKLHLVENSEFIYGGDGKLILRGEQQFPNDYCYIEFDSSGFLNLHLEVEKVFPKDVIVKPDGINQASLVISTDAKEWDDWVAFVEMDDFIIPDAEDLVFRFDPNVPITYDHSTVEHIAEIADSMDDEKDPLWYGMYIPECTIEMPDLFNSGSTIPVSVEDMILGDNGVTLYASVKNVLKTSQLNEGDWGLTIDDINIRVKRNSFLNGSIDGKLLLPIVENNAQNYLDYSMLLDFDTLGNYQIIVSPDKEITVPLFLADINLAPTSNITISHTNNQFNAAAMLHGDLSLAIADIDMSLVQFQNMQLKTDENFFEPGSITSSLASPDKSMYGFSLGLDSISIEMDMADGARVGLGFEGEIALSTLDISPSAKGEFIVWGKFENGLKDDGVEVKSIQIDASIGDVISINGGIKFYKDDPQWGNGFGGAITLGVAEICTVDIFGKFGTTNYQSNNPYDYFFVQGGYDHAPGVPIFSGFALYTFKGGLGHRVIINNPGDVANGENIEEVASGLQPSRNAGLSFSAGVGFGTHPGGTGRQVLCGDVDLAIGLSENNSGVDYLKLEGDVGLFTNDTYDPTTGICNANMLLSFDFVNSVYQASIGVWFDFVAFSGIGNINIYAKVNEGFHDDYYVKVGSPAQPVTVSLLGGIMKGGVYFQTGNYMIDPLPDIPDRYTEMFNRKGGSKKGQRQEMLDFLDSGSPNKFKMLHGAFAELNINPDLGILYAGINIGLGYGILLAETEGGCGQYDPIGYEGWYAMGDAYFALEAYVGVRVWFVTEIEIELARFEAAAILSAGGLNPTWATGDFHVHGSVLGGLVKIDEQFEFEFGDQCVPATPEYLKGLELITDVFPDNPSDPESLDVTPSASFMLPANGVPIHYKYRHVANGPLEDQLFKFSNKVVQIKQTKGTTIKDYTHEYSLGSYSAHLIFESYLKPLEKYEFNVEAQLQECIDVKKQGDSYTCRETDWRVARYRRDDPDGKYKIGDEFKNEKIIEFTTDRELDAIPQDDITYTFPYEMERHFCYKEDSNPGLSLSLKGIHAFKYCENNDQKVVARFIPLNSTTDLNSVEEVDVNLVYNVSTMNNKTHYDFGNQNGMLLQTEWPNVDLLPSTHYAVQYTIGCESEIGADISGLVASTQYVKKDSTYLSATYIKDGKTYSNTPKIIARELDDVFIPKPGFKPIYQYVFKTSQHENLAEKLDGFNMGDVKFYVFKKNYNAAPYTPAPSSIYSSTAAKDFDCDGPNCWVILTPEELDDVEGNIKQKLNHNDIDIDWNKENVLHFYGPERFDVFDVNGYTKQFSNASKKINGQTHVPPILSFAHDGMRAWLNNIILDWKTWCENHYLMTLFHGSTGQSSFGGGNRLVSRYIDFYLTANPDPALNEAHVSTLMSQILNQSGQSSIGNGKSAYNPNASSNGNAGALSTNSYMADPLVLSVGFMGSTVTGGLTDHGTLLLEELLGNVDPPPFDMPLTQWAQNYGAAYDYLNGQIAAPMQNNNTPQADFNGHPGLIIH